MTQTNPFSNPMLTNMGATWHFQAAYHKEKLDSIRRNLGTNCLYLSHVKEGDRRYIKAVMANLLGGKDTVEIDINSDLFLVQESDYKTVLKALQGRNYERRTKAV